MADPNQPAETPLPDPWYAAGLSFTCTQCGNCCTGEPGFVWVDEAELHAIAEYRGVSYGEVRHCDVKIVGERMSLREYANGDCIYLDSKSRRCMVYSVRPKQCRTWPFWISTLDSPEAWDEARQRCPGAGNGAFFSLKQIQDLAAQVDV